MPILPDNDKRNIELSLWPVAKQSDSDALSGWLSVAAHAFLLWVWVYTCRFVCVCVSVCVFLCLWDHDMPQVRVLGSVLTVCVHVWKHLCWKDRDRGWRLLLVCVCVHEDVKTLASRSSTMCQQTWVEDKTQQPWGFGGNWSLCVR